jgi:hypothetical protein
MFGSSRRTAPVAGLVTLKVLGGEGLSAAIMEIS